MDKLEKVINGMECCGGISSVYECPYQGSEGCDNCQGNVYLDVLSLLKTQEPKPVKDTLVVGGHLMGKCPKCYKVLTVQDYPVTCGFCGQAVKWE